MYKQSNYNYFIPYENRVIYFNALTRNSFLLKPIEHERIQKQFADPISFELEFPTVFKQFAQWGFFVKEEVDEIAVILYRHHKEVTFNREYHLIVSLEAIENVDSFVSSIKKHLLAMASQEHIPFLCLEWVGTDLLQQIDTCLYPVSTFAKELCNQYHIDFRCQLELEMEDDEMVHDKIHHQKGVPTYHTTLRQIENLCSDSFGYSVYLEVTSTGSSLEKKPHFIAQFSPETRQHLTINWKTKAVLEDYLAEKSQMIEKIMSEQEPETNSTNQYPLKSPRMYQNTLVYGGNIYCGKSATFKEQAPKGVLTQDGTIEWDEEVRAQLMGTSWMESAKCRECKHLPLLSAICSNAYHTGKNYCPLKDKLMTPEWLIVQEFKAKGV